MTKMSEDLTVERPVCLKTIMSIDHYVEIPFPILNGRRPKCRKIKMSNSIWSKDHNIETHNMGFRHFGRSTLWYLDIWSMPFWCSCLSTFHIWFRSSTFWSSFRSGPDKKTSLIHKYIKLTSACAYFENKLSNCFVLP